LTEDTRAVPNRRRGKPAGAAALALEIPEAFFATEGRIPGMTDYLRRRGRKVGNRDVRKLLGEVLSEANAIFNVVEEACDTVFQDRDRILDCIALRFPLALDSFYERGFDNLEEVRRMAFDRAVHYVGMNGVSLRVSEPAHDAAVKILVSLFVPELPPVDFPI